MRIRGCAWQCVGRRKHSLWLLLAVGLSVTVVTRLWRFAQVASDALLPPQPPDHDLQHLRRSRSLEHYLDHSQLLIQPSFTRCEGVEEVPLLVLVSSSPSHVDQRAAIRHTWAKHQPTFFILGLEGLNQEDLLVYSYIEAKEFGDMVVFDFLEHYENLTLKTGLMLQWGGRRCPHAAAVFKTDDDVLVNPWAMRDVLAAHQDQQLIGYKLNNTQVHRDGYTKWYMPRWLYPRDHIPEYLSGTGYLIHGEYVQRIQKAAHKVPLVNLEDVYFTHNVAKSALRLTLTHDRRLSPFKPWIPAGCAFWSLASVHSLTPGEISSAWSKIVSLASQFERGEEVCAYLNFLSSDLFLH